MPRNQRDRRDPNIRVVHVTNRAWEGLPFVPNRSMRRMIKSVLARAQLLYPVTICAYLFMTNHYHMVLAGDANRVSLFMGYIDGEIAKRMKRFFPNRWGPKFWADRFKEQHLPTPDAVINKIIYIFCNPMAARLVSKLSTYPGASSLAALTSIDHKTSELCSVTFPRWYKPLNTNYLSKKADFALSRDLHQKAEGFHELRTDLFAWKRCFKEQICRSDALLKITNSIAAAEEKAEALGVIGAKRLQYQAFDRQHSPEKKGRTPFIDCPDEKLRKILIASYQNFRAACRRAWELVKRGLQAEWPHGAFVPSRRWLDRIPIAAL